MTGISIRTLRCLPWALVVWALSPSTGACAAPSAIRLEVDATDAPRHVIHSRMTMAVSPGPVTLLYPKWIPGEHGPTGPIADFSDLHIEAAGREIGWTRDPLEPYSFHLIVPPRVREIGLSFDHTVPFEAGRRMVLATPQLAYVDWNQMLLYPDVASPESLVYRASLRIPEGWGWGSALPASKSKGGGIDFHPVSLVALVDSPVLLGEHFRAVKLGADLDVPYELDLAGETPESIDIDDATVAKLDRLVHEARALFGARHFRAYRFLLALTDGIPYGGLEHHESSENRAPGRSLLEPDLMLRMATLLPHEHAHSWNGKYRCPAGLASPPFLAPMKTDLLWIYEGLTDYLAWVLATRSGLLSPDQARDDLAGIAAYLDHQTGRSWRPLRDVAASAPGLIGSGSGPEGTMRKRALADVYNEAVLLWLEVDSILRKRSDGRVSLDGFCARFFGGESGGPAVRTYTVQDVVSALNALVPYDWSSHFEARVGRTSTRAPVEGIQGSGWSLAYAETASAYDRALDQARKRVDALYSIGLLISREGKVLDVAPEMPAGRAGVIPTMSVVAVNSREWSPEAMRGALRGSRKTGSIDLLVESQGTYRTIRVPYRGGERRPVLVRRAGAEDLLSLITTPRSAPGAHGRRAPIQSAKP